MAVDPLTPEVETGLKKPSVEKANSQEIPVQKDSLSDSLTDSLTDNLADPLGVQFSLSAGDVGSGGGDPGEPPPDAPQGDPGSVQMDGGGGGAPAGDPPPSDASPSDASPPGGTDGVQMSGADAVQFQPEEGWHESSEWFRGQQDKRYEWCMEGEGEHGEATQGDDEVCREQVEEWTNQPYHDQPEEQEQEEEEETEAPECTTAEAEITKRRQEIASLKKKVGAIETELPELEKKRKEHLEEMKRWMQDTGEAPPSTGKRLADLFIGFVERAAGGYSPGDGARGYNQKNREKEAAAQARDAEAAKAAELEEKIDAIKEKSRPLRERIREALREIEGLETFGIQNSDG